MTMLLCWTRIEATMACAELCDRPVPVPHDVVDAADVDGVASCGACQHACGLCEELLHLLSHSQVLGTVAEARPSLTRPAAHTHGWPWTKQMQEQQQSQQWCQDNPHKAWLSMRIMPV